MSTAAKVEGAGRPTIGSLRDLTITEALDPETDETKYTTFYHVTQDEHTKKLFPEVPVGVALTLAPDHLNDDNAWIKRPGLVSYENMRGTKFIPTEILNEVLNMEKLSKAQHPHIVRYLGCRVRRGRITSLYIERLEQTLYQYVSTPEFARLDTEAFMKALQSAIDAIHALGLAHNDLNPYNIMVKEGLPVLIDFGSCLPFGTVLQTGGTTGWVEEDTEVSDRKHDEFAMRKMPGWLEERKREVDNA